MTEEQAAGGRPAERTSAEEFVLRHFGRLPEPQGSLSAFDGRLVVDLDTKAVTVDGRDVRLTHADVRLLRGLIELGEGVHQPHVIMGKVYGAPLLTHELGFPMTVLRTELGEPSWIERTEDGYALRPPEQA
ncbi:hypothetical protein ATKI12_4836 [Kitasatospora sp. Ki12]|uniref:response regulator transcription factor n=1 Tax=Kitasatospora xanthocidica TaxID=83382 RepID=UPI0016779DA6|nr:response regulator transcription factor [Kitasatospora xanthocidica]GHF83329.1 hypothetical protein GCM10018790_71230 [Kitasatospora xanthocidica]